MAVASDQFSDTPKKVYIYIEVLTLNIHFRALNFELIYIFTNIYLLPQPEPPKLQSTTEVGAETTTEKYRISRQELGYILGKNYRGLRKLFNIELQDAQNVSNYIYLYTAIHNLHIYIICILKILQQSRITIHDYRRDFGRALSPYTIPIKLPAAEKKKKDS